MIKEDLRRMLINVYELGLRHGNKQAREERERTTEWFTARDDFLEEYEELVTL